MSKMDAVRQTLAQLGAGAKPLEIKEFLKSRYSIDMSPGMISNYKSTINAGGKSKLIGRGRGRPSSAMSAAGGFTLQDIQAVKQVADRIGADKVRELASVLAK
jgi:hypothetical protein